MSKFQNRSSESDARRAHEDGFTTVELIIAIVVVAAISVIAIMRFGGQSERTAQSVAEIIISDLAYAQEAAIAAGKGVQIALAASCGGCEDNRQGLGHDENIRGEGVNGNGRGHGYGYGHLHHCDESCRVSQTPEGGYAVNYSDGMPVNYPAAAALMNLREQVVVEMTVNRIQFDSGGRLVLPGYNWSEGQQAATVITVNNRYRVNVARETGKSWVTEG
ncbi:MAG: hypothetical protein FJY67_06305 [Calditrichaeota bacterium]|nr:hypothetical protein [Calditrichota bacterium]